ncbi:unnamed protein product [Echinostoma caproni]|uniref:Arrestin_N domain-containing protein n=1 Tax=Echinostoma caproni TaxID=27848 RepID=A0A183A8J0_9TREM|nr:unnamed protein product [Echinostoma caproni]
MSKNLDTIWDSPALAKSPSLQIRANPNFQRVDQADYDKRALRGAIEPHFLMPVRRVMDQIRPLHVEVLQKQLYPRNASFLNGVLCFDTKGLKGQQVHLMITCGCRYGREDLDVLGLTFQKDLLLCTRQIWPETAEPSSVTKRKTARSWRRQRSKEMTPNEEERFTEVQTPECPTGSSNSYEEILIDGFPHSYAQKRLVARLGSKAHPFRIKGGGGLKP